MGGMGSGRRYQGGKGTTEDMRALDIRQLQRKGLLKQGMAFSWEWSRNGEKVASIQIFTEANSVILKYKSRSDGGEWRPMEYPVHLEWTGLNFGGRRAWFLCPAQRCGRRVAILYGGTVFACRHCHSLVYECQRESDIDRAVRRADTIRRLLGWEAGILNPTGDKPKGMHWRTYLRLVNEQYALAEVSLTGMAEQLKLLDRRIGRL